MLSVEARACIVERMGGTGVARRHCKHPARAQREYEVSQTAARAEEESGLCGGVGGVGGWSPSTGSGPRCTTGTMFPNRPGVGYVLIQ
jgi:hypothetical protein